MFALGKWLPRWNPAIGRPEAHSPDPHCLGDIRELRLPKGATPALKRIALSPGCEDLAVEYIQLYIQINVFVLLSFQSFDLFFFSPVSHSQQQLLKLYFFKKSFFFFLNLYSFTSEVLTSEQ